ERSDLFDRTGPINLIAAGPSSKRTSRSWFFAPFSRRTRNPSATSPASSISPRRCGTRACAVTSRVLPHHSSRFHAAKNRRPRTLLSSWQSSSRTCSGVSIAHLLATRASPARRRRRRPTAVRTLVVTSPLRAGVELVTQLEHECEDARRRHREPSSRKLVGEVLRWEFRQVLDDGQNQLRRSLQPVVEAVSILL